ncbi:MAG: ATP-binding protein [Caldilineaceae bacterium]
MQQFAATERSIVARLFTPSRNSLRLRLVLWAVTLEAILLLVLGGVLLFVVQKLENQQVKDTLRLAASQLNAVIDVRDGQYAIEPADITALRRQDILAWALTGEGKLILTIGAADQWPLPTTLPDFGQFADVTLPDGAKARLLTAPFEENGQILGTLVLALTLRDSQEVLRLILLSLAIAIPVALILSLAGGLFLAGRALAPVSTITAMAQQISAADLSQRLQLDLPNDEIGQLAHTFNAMLERLDQAFQRERQLTADVSHELRTPLAMLKTQLSLARSRPREVSTLQEMMADMEGDVDRMTRLIEQMLMLAVMEQGEALPSAPVALTPLLTQVVAQLAPVAAAKGVILQYDLSATTPLQGDGHSLGQVFTNLLENAIKYTPTGGQVTLCAAQEDGQIRVTVIDSGIGIAAEHLPHLFKRFYRADPARTRESGGFGLGLAISRAIVQLHGGQIDVQSIAGQGATFTVSLPCFCPTAQLS